jgi:hypothetical protein
VNSDSQRKPKGRFWRRLRVWFRRFRITVLLVLFGLVCLGGYLNHFGLPEFIKRPLLESLHQRGVDLEFSRLRLRWYRGIVADHVRVLGTNNNPILPEFSAQSADVRLNYRALVHGRLEVTGVTLRNGNLHWQLAPTNTPAEDLAITNITADLQFLPGDEWHLSHLEAQLLGAQFRVDARITNASTLRRWPVFQGRPKSSSPSPGQALERLRQLRHTLLQLHFQQPPEFQLTVTGDAADPLSFASHFTVTAPDAVTPWGEFSQAQLDAQLTAAGANAPPATQVHLAAGSARTPWAALRELDLQLDTTQTDTDELHCVLELRAAAIQSQWASAQHAEINADWHQGFDALTPRRGSLRTQLRSAESRWVKSGSLEARVDFRPATNGFTPDAVPGWWGKLLPYALTVDCRATNVMRDDIQLDSLAVAAEWQAPYLQLSQLEARPANGSIAARAELDVLTRRLDFDSRACFDFRLLDSVLTEKSRAWINHFTWQQPPAVAMAGHLTLPAWTNRQPDWRGEVQPGIVLQGYVNLTNGSYRGISALNAVTHLNYSNRVWHLPDLTLTRPEGVLHVNLQSDEITHDYAIALNGQFDPRALASQLDEKGQRALDYFAFTNAPWIAGEVRGRWYERERTSARASIIWTNFSYRDQHADRLSAALAYSNQVLEVFQPRVDRGAEYASADGVRFDFAAQRAYLTNGFSNTDPLAIARAIGPKTAAAIDDYQFLQPPVAHVEGVIPLRGEKDADLHFALEGGPFRWQKFNLPHVSGHVHWANESVVLSNMVASFYGGTAHGNAWFDVSTPGSTPFRFDLSTTNADLHALMADLHSPTNRLEGRITGELIVTSANTTDWKSWNGRGRASLRDGLIWDTPIFGVMSSVMNTIVPGIGNSRASEAAGSYTISNSVIHTRDLDIRASGMRLQYEGTVDFTTRVDARVQAELLRDTWFVGKLVSTALWPVSKLFEYKVTGTLADPKPEPVYLIPKMFLAPLHPMRAIKGMLQYTPAETNAPPDFAPVAPAPPAQTPGN